MHWIVFFISAIGVYLMLSFQLGKAGGLFEIILSFFIAGILHVSRSKFSRESKKSQKERNKGRRN